MQDRGAEVLAQLEAAGALGTRRRGDRGGRGEASSWPWYATRRCKAGGGEARVQVVAAGLADGVVVIGRQAVTGAAAEVLLVVAVALTRGSMSVRRQPAAVGLLGTGQMHPWELLKAQGWADGGIAGMICMRRHFL